MNKEDYLYIGKIANTFGIKGELKILSDSDFLSYRFRKGAKIYLKLANKMQQFEVSSFRLLKNNAVIKLKNLEDINLVNMYIGADIYCDKNDTPPLEEGVYMLDNLVGLKVETESGVFLGTVKDFILGGPNPILEIVKDDEKERLVPFVDAFVKDVKEDKIVIIDYEVVS